MIRTARLLLRPAETGDLDDLHQVFSDPRAMRYWSHETHDSPDRTQRVLDGMIASQRETGCEFVLDLDGRVIGKAGMWRAGEIGYILHPDFWGRGLMREALEALLPFAFARHRELAAITAEIDPRNVASSRLLARLGFAETHRKARTLFLYDEWCDSVYWRLARPGPA